jgi:hypothetical protein
MRGVAFLFDWVSLRRLLTRVGFAPQRTEPLAHAAPGEVDCLDGLGFVLSLGARVALPGGRVLERP